MSAKVNRAAYERLVSEDLAWLEAQPRTLERDHIIAIVKASVDMYYRTDVATTELACGHTVADLIGGTDPATGRKLVTKCGSCLSERAEAPPYEPPPSAAALLAKAEEHETRARACRIQAAAIVGGS